MPLDGRSTGAEVAALLGGGSALRGRTALVTGASSGLGAETARVLAACGATVVIGVLPALLDGAVRELRAAVPQAEIVPLPLDLASLDAVRAAAAAVVASGRPIHVLVNNAGIMACPCTASADGYEAQLAVNYLGHAALTLALLPALRAGAPARVVALSSAAHALLTPLPDGLPWDRLGLHAASAAVQAAYDPWEAYGCSKLAVAIFAAELQRRSDAAGWGLQVASVHPGAILGTGLKRFVGLGTVVRMLAFPRLRAFVLHSERPITKSIPQGVATTVFAVLTPSLVPGGYYANCAPVAPGDPFLLPHVHDPAVGARLWEVTEALIAPGARAAPDVATAPDTLPTKPAGA